MGEPRIRLLTRPGCHLCDTAAADLHEIARQLDVKVTMVALLLKASAATLPSFPRFARELLTAS